MIPKKIYQTHKDYELPEETKRLMHRLISLNTDFEYVFMDNDECDKFISDNFEEDFVNMYRNLPLDIMRSDVWRVAVIYINGGVYCDTDVYCLRNLSNLIEERDIVFFTESSGGTSNFFFAASPKNRVLKAVLNIFLKEQTIARDTKSDWMVQNFGMHSLHRVVNQLSNDFKLTYDESKKWVNHLCYNTWKKSEAEYKNNSNSNKPTTFVTTFHKNGYDLYGKVWIDSLVKNVLSQRNNINCVIYAQNIPDLNINHPQIQVLDFDKEIPHHEDWKKNYLSLDVHSPKIRDMTVRFSHKGFVIQHALSSIRTKYLIWTDGDVVFKKYSHNDFPACILKNNEALACQIEDCNHVETGLIIFDTEHEDLYKFIDAYVKNYKVESLSTYGEPYDGHVTRRSLAHSNVPYYDLNKSHGVGGIQSDPNETFLHPELKNRFIHNIGVTGKRFYTNWSKLKNKDSIFSILENSGFKPFTEMEKKIIKLRNKR